jgi:natural product biosynthesis luciferase-like monooxygenase protein
VSTTLDATLADRLPTLCEPAGVSPFDAVLAACALAYARHAGVPQADIGAPACVSPAGTSAGRARLRRLTVDLRGDPRSRELLRRARDAARSATTNAADASPTPVALLVDEIDHPLCAGASVSATSEDVSAELAACDLVVELRRSGPTLTLVGDYDADLFSAATIGRVLTHVRLALAGLLTCPDARVATLPLLADEERALVTSTWNATHVDVESDVCVHELIERQVARTPDRIALRCRGQALSYRELDRRANRLAHRLVARGVGPDVLVGICLDRSLDLPVAVLAVLKAGGAYVPLDPAYPRARLEYMWRDSHAAVLLTRGGLPLDAAGPGTIRLDGDDASSAGDASDASAPPVTGVRPEHAAYVIYTSGSTGAPKGVLVEHRNVVNFFAGMDDRLAGPPGVWLAVTSLSFDISVLELLWPLTRGDEVVLYAGASLGSELSAAGAARTGRGRRAVELGLFYFGSDDDSATGAQSPGRERYRLLLDGARFADQHGFSAVWTPERHFHRFGGLYPSPCVTSAALATITSRVQIRAGSVVLPLNDPVRVAEEWSVIDNLSDGRVAISFASGWQPEDFVFAPQHYARRHDVMFDGVDLVRRLWRGEETVMPGGHGREVVVRLRPRPVQPELPCWITAGGTLDTFRRAGEIGANVLTHLLGQSIDELAGKIATYRDAWRPGGHAERHGVDDGGHVTLMLHTFVGDDEARVRAAVHEPLARYLRSSVSLFAPFAAALGLDVDHLSPQDLDVLAEHAFERYYTTSGLFGTPTSCLATIDRLREIGVDEIACLIDFGAPPAAVLRNLPHLAELRERAQRCGTIAAPADEETIDALVRRHGVTHLQCTPSLASMLVAESTTAEALRGLRVLLVGGEALSTSLASTLCELVEHGCVLNMYGPTETTIWSTAYTVDAHATRHEVEPIGRPIANTQVYVVDDELQPVPIGATGELLLGGRGVARGYLGRPELTAERFVEHPIAGPATGRCYRTGDLARYRADGVIEYVGRRDEQVKLRGHRVELGEIEATLRAHPDVAAAVVTARADADGERRLAAYLVPRPGLTLRISDVRSHAATTLPAAWMPAAWMVLAELPLTANGKVDTRALPAPESATADDDSCFEAPRDDLERTIAASWCAALRRGRIDVRDNFFSIGGHSLLVIHVLKQLSVQLDRSLSMADMFRHPTVREFAAFLAASGGAAADSSAPAAPPLGPIVSQPRVLTPR